MIDIYASYGFEAPTSGRGFVEAHEAFASSLRKKGGAYGHVAKESRVMARLDIASWRVALDLSAVNRYYFNNDDGRREGGLTEFVFYTNSIDFAALLTSSDAGSGLFRLALDSSALVAVDLTGISGATYYDGDGNPIKSTSASLSFNGTNFYVATSDYTSRLNHLYPYNVNLAQGSTINLSATVTGDIQFIIHSGVYAWVFWYTPGYNWLLDVFDSSTWAHVASVADSSYVWSPSYPEPWADGSNGDAYNGIISGGYAYVLFSDDKWRKFNASTGAYDSTLGITRVSGGAGIFIGDFLITSGCLYYRDDLDDTTYVIKRHDLSTDTLISTSDTFTSTDANMSMCTDGASIYVKTQLTIKQLDLSLNLVTEESFTSEFSTAASAMGAFCRYWNGYVYLTNSTIY